MRAKAGILLIICFLFLIETVAAVGIPDTVTVTTDKSWVIANNGDQSTLTVKVTNTTLGFNGTVPGVTVNLAVDPQYGTLSPTIVTTNPSGMASSTFKVRTKSGAAQITATIPATSISDSVIQNIDHDSPYYPFFSYPLNGEVASKVAFNISVTDRWGNLIDSRKEVALSLPLHKLSLHIHGPAPDDCYFTGNGHDIYPTLDQNGNVSVNVNLTSKIGLNYILMDQFGSISDTVKWITTEATGIPSFMTGSISDGGILPVGTTPFTIEYLLYDVYGNPVKNRSIWVNTTLPNEQQMYTSNSLGQIQLSYGPKIAVSDIPISATSVDNHTVSNQLVAHFIHAGPTNMVLAVTPQSMASREVAPSQQVFVRATVIDLLGNPVPNESVRFDIIDINNGGFNISAVNGTPSFSSTSYLNSVNTTTDKDGNAIVLFYPGSFPKRTESGYNSAANASCTIKATWNTVIHNVVVNWKNYPYLSVEASTTPQTIRLNDTVDVSINVTGDGYAMGGAPVTAILDMDCTSNMFQNQDQPPSYPKRIDSAKAAAEVFVDEMVQGQDYVGLTSFGTYKNDQFHLPPQPSMALVKTKIIALVKGTNAQDFVPSITDSLENITSTQPYRPQDEVRAVIILHDAGASNVGSAEEDAIVSAALSQNPKIYLFTILYYDGKSTSSSTEATMRNLANRTGGKFFKPSTPQELQIAYKDIAGILHTIAGVNATMNINYKNVTVNSTPISGGQAFDYIPVEKGVTSPDSRTTILWPNNSRSFKNQSNEWTAVNNYQLHFDIGTINISERWGTTYRLKANQTGLIKLFDNTSTISFNNGVDQLQFPDLFITVTPNFTLPGSQTGTLVVSNLTSTKSGKITDTIPVTWNLKYTGFAKATEAMWYSENNGPWVLFSSQSDIDPGDNMVHYAQLDVRKLPPGGYRIKVHAVAPDAIDSEEITESFTVTTFGTFIKLE